MKKTVVFAIFLVLISLSIFAQGFYFDIGLLGLGKVWTEIEDIDMVDALKDAGVSVDYFT
ncbi:MAG: hypothetical protein LBD58_05360 [Treponema sp.]|jgi:hypothetical protein|nr:hypothetical protein [Treponema sp.]